VVYILIKGIPCRRGGGGGGGGGIYVNSIAHARGGSFERVWGDYRGEGCAVIHWC